MKYIDAEKLKAEIEKMRENNRRALMAEHITVYEFNGRAQAINYLFRFITSLQQEQPDVDLEKEIKRGWEELEKDYSPSALDKSYIIVSGLVWEKQFSRIARHFYELGLNARKEE